MFRGRDLFSEIVYSFFISIVLIASIINPKDDFWAMDILIGLIVSCLYIIWLETSTKRFSISPFTIIDPSNRPLKVYTLFLKQFLDIKAAIFILLYIAISIFVNNFDFNMMFNRLVLLGVTGVFISSLYLCLIFYNINTKNYRYYFLFMIALPVVFFSFVYAVFKIEVPELFLIYPPSVLLIWVNDLEWYGYLLAFISFAISMTSGYVLICKLRTRFNYKFN
ncbi:hypothetical protein EV194_105143 [Natronoflexus pectinivorans]|uniref:Uncharacterized protein n=1 Tax=Natronoflexus pectinivorans TaxID=682526 RepID=A0A4R2GID7_9BACT|nr:hypothetical protein EV194_105143 [Natronoflexus pectinivorans]